MASKNFIVVNRDTGEIIKAGRVAGHMISKQANEDQIAFEYNGPRPGQFDYWDFRSKSVRERPGARELFEERERNRKQAEHDGRKRKAAADAKIRAIMEGRSQLLLDDQVKELAKYILGEF